MRRAWWKSNMCSRNRNLLGSLCVPDSSCRAVTLIFSLSRNLLCILCVSDRCCYSVLRFLLSLVQPSRHFNVSDPFRAVAWFFSLWQDLVETMRKFYSWRISWMILCRSLWEDPVEIIQKLSKKGETPQEVLAWSGTYRSLWEKNVPLMIVQKSFWDALRKFLYEDFFRPSRIVIVWHFLGGFLLWSPRVRSRSENIVLLPMTKAHPCCCSPEAA